MSASIGSVNIDILRGRPAPLKLRTEVYVVPGLNGDGAQTLGSGDAQAELTSIAYLDSSSDADTHLADCAALQGTVVTIVDDWGTSFAHVLVDSVDIVHPAVKRPCIYNGNASAVRVEVHWRVVTVS